MNPSPRTFFRQHHKEDAAQLAVTINEPWFQRAVVAAQAELSTIPISTDFQKGAAAMVATLYALAEEEQPPLPSYPPDPVLKTYR